MYFSMHSAIGQLWAVDWTLLNNREIFPRRNGDWMLACDVEGLEVHANFSFSASKTIELNVTFQVPDQVLDIGFDEQGVLRGSTFLARQACVIDLTSLNDWMETFSIRYGLNRLDINGDRKAASDCWSNALRAFSAGQSAFVRELRIQDMDMLKRKLSSQSPGTLEGIVSCPEDFIRSAAREGVVYPVDPNVIRDVAQRARGTPDPFELGNG